MAFKCKIGLHSWNGCKCSGCGKIRDEQHDWSQDCERCSTCGKCRDDFHYWNDDCEKCSKCGKTRENHHDWSTECEKCSNCGKTRANQHNWIGCKCSKCDITRDEQHDWNGCKCSICGLEKHNWNCYICSNCNTVDYLGLLNRMYETASVGDIIFDKNLNKSSDTKILAYNSLSECKTEAQKQELVCNRFNYLISVVQQSYSTGGIYMATNYLIEIQPTLKEIVRRHDKK